MTYDNLRLIRNLLLRTFVVGLGITLLLALLTFSLWDTWVPIVERMFHTNIEFLTPIVVEFFMQVRFFLLYIVLAPALAIHWTLKKA